MRYWLGNKIKGVKSWWKDVKREFNRGKRIGEELQKEWEEKGVKFPLTKELKVKFLQEVQARVHKECKEEIQLEANLLKGMIDSLENMRVVNYSDPVTEEDVKEYYERYLAKREQDDKYDKYEWNAKPIYTYEEYKERAMAPHEETPVGEKYVFRSNTGWHFLMSTTSSCMIGGLDGKPPIFM